MATTTPNFGWPVPTSTDLVKDGATAMEALGDAIDTSMVDLKGGTTGQVLAKASNTDMDFSWVAQDDSNAIQNSIVNAKGDLIGASANDTPAILSVGANGETLVADSSTATGLRYTAGTVQSNPVLNSAFQIWQRGTANTTGGYVYTADRWQKGNDTYYGVSRQVTGDTTNLPNIQYCARVQRTAGSVVTSSMLFAQSIETLNSVPFAGKTVTFSFYARAGANYSATSNSLTFRVDTGTGTDQNIISGYTGGASTISSTATLTTTWQRFSASATIPAATTELGILFVATPTGTAGANDYFEVTGVQIDIGSVALPFRTYAGTIQGELAACQRYYYQTNPIGNGYARLGLGRASSTTNIEFPIPLPVAMRIVPTSVTYANLTTTTANTITAVAFSQASTTCGAVDATASSLTSGSTYVIMGNNSTSAYIAFSAEL